MPSKTPRKPAKAAKKSVKKPASNVIVVPQPAKGSYNPHRPLEKNTLLLHQVRHFQLIEQTMPGHMRTDHDPTEILTEGHAAEYLRKMTHKLHPNVQKAPAE